TAKDLGLVNEVLPDEELIAHGMDRARKLQQKPRGALRETKALLKGHMKEAMLSHLDEEARVFCRLLREPNCKEAIQAFFEKRRPVFRRD
ncbi:MAG: enoyl-CoA hydratase, partial [Polyangiaceae bacterium]|nr:enoyl-CoA hydratase [Polyangiaceae bacterium]